MLTEGCALQCPKVSTLVFFFFFATTQKTEKEWRIKWTWSNLVFSLSFSLILSVSIFLEVVAKIKHNSICLLFLPHVHPTHLKELCGVPFPFSLFSTHSLASSLSLTLTLTLTRTPHLSFLAPILSHILPFPLAHYFNMPPKRVPLFTDCTVSISGTYKTHTQGDISALITTNGGAVTPSVTKATTHLITTDKELEKNTAKVQKAVDMGILLVTLDWVVDSISKKKRQSEASYKVSDGAVVAVAATAPVTPAATPGSSTPDSTSGKRKADDDLDGAVEKKIKDLNKKVAAKAAKVSPSTIKKPPVDRSCSLPAGYEVYVDSVVAWNARLNQTNINANNNKFYLIQLLGNSKGQYAVFSHWGRVGANGQTQTIHCGDINGGMREFKKKFSAKSGNQWDDRDNFVKVPGKCLLYFFSNTLSHEIRLSSWLIVTLLLQHLVCPKIRRQILLAASR